MNREQRLEEQRRQWWVERAHAMTVPCPEPECAQPIDSACVDPDGEPLQGQVAHWRRTRDADRAPGPRPDRAESVEQPERTVTVDEGIRSQPCNYCREPIVWASTVNAKAMPVDAEPVDSGNVLLTVDHGRVCAGVLGHNQAAGARQAGRKLYQHHKLTCRFKSDWGRR